MAYATPATLATRVGADRLIEITDRDADGIGDDPMVAQALADAEAEIDSYLAVRYALPLPTAPLMLARIACDIAVYRLLTLRRMGDVEDARVRYEDARRLLEGIAKGLVSLGLPTNLTGGQNPGLSLASSLASSLAASMAAVKTGPLSVFGRDGTGGF